jgi:hypothetical protein
MSCTWIALTRLFPGFQEAERRAHRLVVDGVDPSFFRPALYQLSYLTS